MNLNNSHPYCPICNKKNKGVLKNWENSQKHITSKARIEVWQKALGTITETPHFDRYMKMTEPVSITTKRTFKSEYKKM